MPHIGDPEREQRKIDEFNALPDVFHFAADGENFLGAKSICSRCKGPLLLTLTLKQALALEFSELTSEAIAETILAGMVADQIVCGRCRRVQAN